MAHLTSSLHSINRLLSTGKQINLWYTDVVYQFHLGDLLSIRTTHLSSNSPTTTSMESSQPTMLSTNLFPESDVGCSILVATPQNSEQAIYGTPLGYVSGRPLFGLMSLKAFLQLKAHGVLDAKILVCVKAVRGMSTSTSTTKEIFAMFRTPLFTTNLCSPRPSSHTRTRPCRQHDQRRYLRRKLRGRLVHPWVADYLCQDVEVFGNHSSHLFTWKGLWSSIECRGPHRGGDRSGYRRSEMAP